MYDASDSPVGPTAFDGLRRRRTRVLLARCMQAAHGPASDMGPETVDWPLLTRAGCTAWLGGLILAAAERNRWYVPPPQMRQLRWQARQIRQHNLRMMGCLSRIALALHDQGVKILLLKGAALNLTLYDAPELRPMSDLDLLVHPETVAEAATAMERLGYRRGPGLVRSDFFPRFHYEVEYQSDGPRPVSVDLHVRPFRPLRHAHTVPDDAFWRRSRRLDVGRAPVWVLGHEEQLVHLATHSAYHGHSRLLWLYDIRRLIDLNNSNFDWERTLRTCRELGLVLPVRTALRAMESLWGPICPDHIRQDLYDQPVDWRDRLCLAQAPHDANHSVRHVAVNLLCTQGLSFRLAYLSRVLFPDREHMGQVYCRRHWGWLLCAHVRRWWRAAVGAHTSAVGGSTSSGATATNSLPAIT